MYGAKTWKLRKVDQEYLESFEGWCWRRIEKISWNGRVGNGKKKKCYGELRRRGIERNILYTMKGRKANWIGHIVRRNFLLKQVIEG